MTLAACVLNREYVVTNPRHDAKIIKRYTFLYKITIFSMYILLVLIKVWVKQYNTKLLLKFDAAFLTSGLLLREDTQQILTFKSLNIRLIKGIKIVHNIKHYIFNCVNCLGKYLGKNALAIQAVNISFFNYIFNYANYLGKYLGKYTGYTS